MFAPIATLIVGFLVAFVAFQQWLVARHKLRLDLFDRRYKIYDATRKFLSVIVARADFEDSQLFEFYAGTSDAEFFFDADVVDYLAEIRKRSVDLRTHNKIFSPLPVGEERSRHVQGSHDQLVWLGEQLTSMKTVFAPYLGFAHIK